MLDVVATTLICATAWDAVNRTNTRLPENLNAAM